MVTYQNSRQVILYMNTINNKTKNTLYTHEFCWTCDKLHNLWWLLSLQRVHCYGDIQKGRHKRHNSTTMISIKLSAKCVSQRYKNRIKTYQKYAVSTDRIYIQVFHSTAIQISKSNTVWNCAELCNNCDKHRTCTTVSRHTVTGSHQQFCNTAARHFSSSTVDFFDVRIRKVADLQVTQ